MFCLPALLVGRKEGLREGVLKVNFGAHCSSFNSLTKVCFITSKFWHCFALQVFFPNPNANSWRPIKYCLSPLCWTIAEENEWVIFMSALVFLEASIPWQLPMHITYPSPASPLVYHGLIQAVDKNLSVLLHQYPKHVTAQEVKVWLLFLQSIHYCRVTKLRYVCITSLFPFWTSLGLHSFS